LYERFGFTTSIDAMNLSLTVREEAPVERVAAGEGG
jgi:hypothetical protein